MACCKSYKMPTLRSSWSIKAPKLLSNAPQVSRDTLYLNNNHAMNSLEGLTLDNKDFSFTAHGKENQHEANEQAESINSLCCEPSYVDY
jgi:hypothetical protein